MKRKDYGFTVVELLTVVSIIAILVGLLLPAASMVRRVANETKQRAQFTTIGLALMVFKNDFGDYPPSHISSDKNTYDTGGNYCGAQKLTEALLGRDLLGFHPGSNWDATDSTYYTVEPTESELKQRKEYYIELAATNAFRLGNISSDEPGLFNDAISLEPRTFVICDAFGVKKISLTAGGKTTILKAGTPILYYKANITSKTFWNTVPPDRIYNYLDNWALIALGRLRDGNQHEMFDRPIRFRNCIRDMRVVKPWPYRPDSYILISAGSDGEYGTKDDIFNF